jgi:uncharacterized damage-inducible protein DinB
MNYYGAKELAESFRTVRKNTLIIAQDIGEQHYNFRPAPDTRSVAETLVHIAIAPQFQEQIHAVERRTTLVGFDFPARFGLMMAEEKAPRTKDQILALLRENGERWAKWLESVSDDFLGERVSMPPGGTPASRTRFDMLLSVKEHEMHHRAQLMLMERMNGIVPHITRAMQERMAAVAAPKG